MTGYDFPFGIAEVADQLPLKKRKPGRTVIITTVPSAANPAN